MLQYIAVLLEWLPKISYWVLAPAALILFPLAFVRATRPGSALGLTIVAAVSASFLSIGLVAIVSGYGKVILHVFQDFGPIVTANFLTTLLPGVGTQLTSLVPVMATTVGSSAAVVVLRRGARRDRLATDSSTAA